MSLDQTRLLESFRSAHAELGRVGLVASLLEERSSLHDISELIFTGIQVELKSEERFEPNDEPVLTAQFIVFRARRTGPAKSLKASNVTREISRTIYVPALVGAASLTISGPAGALAAFIGISYALFNATSATVGYSDACVLHKAWKLAKADNRDFVTENELVSVKLEIATEYAAPKCNSETEILDAIENLKGLKAVIEENGKIYLREKIICFENGEIKN